MHSYIQKTTTNNQNTLIQYGAEESTEDLLYEFLKDRRPTTAKSYRIDLKEFLQFTQKYFNVPRINGKKVHFEDIKRVHVVKFKNYYEATPNKFGKPYAPNTINRKISSVSSFFQFLVQREILDKNPAEFCVRPKRLVVRETEAFSDLEMKHLTDLVMRKASPLHAGVILLAFSTGMRNHEIRNIKLKDFRIQEGIRILSYIGKGQKPNQVPIHPVTGHYLDKYIAWMEYKGRRIMPEDYLFQPTKSSTGKVNKQKLSPTALGYIVKKWSRKVNPKKRITPHSARATFVSTLLNNGVDIYTVAQSVGHADTRTTQRYDKRKRNFNKSPIFGLNFF